jgi:hypothetical protein
MSSTEQSPNTLAKTYDGMPRLPSRHAGTPCKTNRLQEEDWDTVWCDVEMMTEEKTSLAMKQLLRTMQTL